MVQPAKHIRGRCICNEHQDEVLHELGPPTDLPGHHHRGDTRQSCERRSQSLGLIRRVVRESQPRGLSEERDAPENILGGLLSEARQTSQTAVAGRCFQLRERIDIEDFMDLPDLRHAEAGDRKHLDEARWNLLSQLLENPGSSCGHDLGDNLKRRWPHTLRGRQRTGLESVAQVAGKSRTARAAVRKARTRNGFSFLSSRNAAICSST